MTPKLSEPFALVIPRSNLAIKALRLRGNDTRWVDPQAYPSSLSLRKRSPLGKLDLAMFRGRRHLSFGSSRAADFPLPKVEGISGIHFVLKFDLDCLCLKDRSQAGTWISDSPDGPFERLHQNTLVVSNNISIRVGELWLELRFTDLKSQPAFRQQLQYYRTTITGLGKPARTLDYADSSRLRFAAAATVTRTSTEAPSLH